MHEDLDCWAIKACNDKGLIKTQAPPTPPAPGRVKKQERKNDVNKNYHVDCYLILWRAIWESCTTNMRITPIRPVAPMKMKAAAISKLRIARITHSKTLAKAFANRNHEFQLPGFTLSHQKKPSLQKPCMPQAPPLRSRFNATVICAGFVRFCDAVL